jgi:hypothetical protein
LKKKTDGRITVRDENVDVVNGITGIIQEKSMLEKMLAEQPTAPTTLADMLHGQVSGVKATSHIDPPFEKYPLAFQLTLALPFKSKYPPYFPGAGNAIAMATSTIPLFLVPAARPTIKHPHVQSR